jgi:hypothetical protein
VGHEEGFGVGADLVHDAVVFAQNKLQFVVVGLEFIFLEEDNLGGLRDFNADTGKALGLTDKGQDFRVKVDIKLVVVGVTDDKSGLETNFSLFDLIDPLGAPQSLEGNKCEGNFVVLLQGLLAFSLLNQLWGELLHRVSNSVEQMATPSNRARNSRQIPYKRRCLSALSIQVFNLTNLVRVVVEKESVLLLQVVAEVLSLQNAMELPQELE